MSGPMQWTPQGLIPAMTSARVGGIQGARVVGAIQLDEDDDDVEDASSELTRPAPRATVRKPVAKLPTPKDVVKLARARLREVKRELRRMRGLEEERAELERLINAAENKPRAVVRELPKRTVG